MTSWGCSFASRRRRLWSDAGMRPAGAAAAAGVGSAAKLSSTNAMQPTARPAPVKVLPLGRPCCCRVFSWAELIGAEVVGVVRGTSSRGLVELVAGFVSSSASPFVSTPGRWRAVKSSWTTTAAGGLLLSFDRFWSLCLWWCRPTVWALTPTAAWC